MFMAAQIIDEPAGNVFVHRNIANLVVNSDTNLNSPRLREKAPTHALASSELSGTSLGSRRTDGGRSAIAF